MFKVEILYALFLQVYHRKEVIALRAMEGESAVSTETSKVRIIIKLDYD